jgi:hypothetical protein
LPPRRLSLKKSLRAIERAFADLERSLAQLGKQARRVAGEAARNARRSDRETGRWVGVLGKPRRQLRITPKRRAQLKLQGVYMTYVRQLGPRQKARVRTVKDKRGFEAAIGVAKRMAARK